MSLRHKLWIAGLAPVMLMMAVTNAHAHERESSSAASGVISSEPFWVKVPTGSSKISQPGMSLGAHKGKIASQKNGRERKTSSLIDTDGLKKGNSIATELSGNKSVPWSIVFGLTLLTLLPALLLSMTPLVRLLVVFHFLRQALGTQTAPSNQVLMGLALMMTWFLIQPVLLEVEQQAVTPYSAGTITGLEAMDRGIAPVKQYMLRYAREKDLAVFASAGLGARPNRKEDLPIQVVVPAYILSELKAGFQIGAILFLPFLLVDLVVASITTSIGMMQLPPVVISTPLKILLFVMVDGWNLLADQLIKSF
jgi:flagellar biosynthesis protein FliP